MNESKLSKVNIIQYEMCHICVKNTSQQNCKQCDKPMCLDIICIDLQDNNLCSKCYHKNSEIQLKEQLENGSLVQCDNCGNIWDGNAQCNCWFDQDWNDDISDSDEENINELKNDIHVIENEDEQPKKKTKY